MTSNLPSNDGETAGITMEQIAEGGTLITSSLPHLEASEKSSGGKMATQSGSTNFSSEPQSAREAVAPSSKRGEAGKSPRLRSASSKQASSSIPLPVTKNPSKTNSPTKLSSPSKSSTKSNKLSPVLIKNQGVNKHSLEMQFMNKKKMFVEMQKELLEKKKPVIDLYHNLLRIKKKLEELGKIVTVEDIKITSIIDEGLVQKSHGDTLIAGGESVPNEIVDGMQSSIEEIPKTLLDISKNLLDRRNAIVELLENVAKSEINVNDLADQIVALKTEGSHLQNNLDVVIVEHEAKIKEIVSNWQKLLSEKVSAAKLHNEGDENEVSKLYEESKQAIVDLKQKLDEKKSNHDGCIVELNNVISGLKEQIQKLEQDLEAERKSTVDLKNRNNMNNQTTKNLRNRVNELEAEKKATETINAELERKVKYLQDQLKRHESQWSKEREELTKSIKHHESVVQKLTAEKSSFETRLSSEKNQNFSLKDSLESEVRVLQNQVEDLNNQMEQITYEKNEAQEKCKEMTEYISKLATQGNESMKIVTKSIEWGQGFSDTRMEEYSDYLMKDIIIQEYKDKIKHLEEDNASLRQEIAVLESNQGVVNLHDTEKAVLVQQDIVSKYKQLLADSEKKLNENQFQRSQEVAKLTAEIKLLKVRQEHLEEMNQKCPTDHLKDMMEEGRNKLCELMKKSMESEQKILHCENIIEKQSRQMNEMENLLRYRENMAGVLKATRDELVIEKEGLSKYSHEMRNVLSEMSKECNMKDRLIRELQVKIEIRDREIARLEKRIHDLENNLAIANEKRYRLQDRVGKMEKELQTSKAHANQIAEVNTRYDIDMQQSSTNFKINTTRTNRLEVSSSISTFSTSSSKQNTEYLIRNPRKIKIKGIDPTSTNCSLLIGLSLKQIDQLRSRLNNLSNYTTQCPSSTEFPMDNPEKMKQNAVGFNLKSNNSIKSSSVRINSARHKNLAKVMELTAKRYEHLQQEAYDSYEELTNLVRLAVSNHE